jgi:hypothetical protein
MPAYDAVMKKPILPAAAVIALLVQTNPAVAALTGPPTNLPVYTGAQKLPYQISKPIKRCGGEMAMTVYRSTASMAAVERWYASKIPGATIVKESETAGNGGMSGTLMVVPGGAEGVTLSERAAAAGGGTVIGLTAYDPPYSDRDVALIRAAGNGDRAAQATLKRLCPSDEQ